MEWRVPVQRPGGEAQWVTARSERRTEGNQTVKTVSVQGNPFSTLVVAPWDEDATVVASTPAGAVADSPPGHLGWSFSGASADIVLTLE